MNLSFGHKDLISVKWFELDICSEVFHSWGQQGVEVACKTWLSGGRVMCNQRTWYAHMFRTGGFGGFPYSNPQSKVNENRELSRKMFQHNQWPLAKHSFQWLLDKFKPPDWGITRAVVLRAISFSRQYLLSVASTIARSRSD